MLNLKSKGIARLKIPTSGFVILCRLNDYMTKISKLPVASLQFWRFECLFPLFFISGQYDTNLLLKVVSVYESYFALPRFQAF